MALTLSAAMASPPDWWLEVEPWLSLQQLISMQGVNKAWKAACDDDLFWMRCCKRLAAERRLYIPSKARQGYRSGSEMFVDLWQSRYRFVADEDIVTSATATAATKQEHIRFSMNVCVRFKPRGPSHGSVGAGEEDGVRASNRTVLPLHQVLGTLRERAQKRPKDAWAKSAAVPEGPAEESGSESDVEIEAASSTSTTTTRSARPEQRRERSLSTASTTSSRSSTSSRSTTGDNDRSDEEDDEDEEEVSPAALGAMQIGVLAVQAKSSSVLAVAPGVGIRSFHFNRVLADTAAQEEVYNASAVRLVMDCMNGFNATMLVYGQTGSGKTHTMFGPNTTGSDRGIVPRACEEILRAIQIRRRQGIEATLAVSFVEVYGNEVSDLLRDGRIVGQSRVAGQRYVLEGHSEVAVSKLAEIDELLERGNAQKRRAATAMNERSSRAHTIFVMSVVQRDAVGATASVAATEIETAGGPRRQQQQRHLPFQSGGVEVTSRLILCDLGGAEQLSKSKVDEGTHMAGTVPWTQYYEERQRQREAININSGLFALKKCIDALNQRQEAVQAGLPVPYVPYQDSKLTMLLSGALGGDSRTCVVVAASQDKRHANETIQALRFGESCARVTNTAKVSHAHLAAALKALDTRIAFCRERIQAEERWENIVTIRQDLDGEERVTKSVLVGGEKYKMELESLLGERSKLLGE